MATDDEDNEFQSYFERILPKCNPLKDLIKSTVAEQVEEALKSSPPKSAVGEGQSLTYLERLNEKLMQRILKEGGDPLLTPPAPASANPPAPAPAPAPEPAKKPFWR